MTPRIEKSVFISYRRTNLPWALAIYQDLTHQGYDVFFDYQSIDSGNFEKVIMENIKARAHFLLILTPSTLERCNEPGDWLRREIETALDEGRNIIPLMLEGFEFGGSSTTQALTGNLASIKHYNGLRIYAEYFFEGMTKLRQRFLNVALSDIPLQPLSNETQKFVKAQETVVNEAPIIETKQLTALDATIRLNLVYESNVIRYERERLNLARELHDSVLNEMTAIMLKESTPSFSLEFQESFERLVQRIREIVADLRPPMLNFGLKLALEALKENLSERKRDGVDIVSDIQSDGDWRYPESVEQNLYRIVQEACENSLKYAKSRIIQIFANFSVDKITIKVMDDGIGFDVEINTDFEDLLSKKLFGFMNMHERANLIGAKIEITSKVGQGTQIQVTWNANLTMNN